ncbi:glycosyltransferase family 61 protein [Nocardioides sp.]|uniref:glycosyltransferase family 61 protein n=1 Tax=Nocardioides sp. TaxID=35761 RepID=UPI002B275F6F|nr:glycosyltransferase 61 family protein [Nocardioides sp.]
MSSTPRSWAVPQPPFARVGEMSLTPVDDALLTPVKRGKLRSLVTPDRWLRGAVHDAEGALVVASQKTGGLGGNQLVAADPERVPPRPRAPRLDGTWLYGGHWIGHFGHFFTETVTTLWPGAQHGVDVSRLDGIVFHSYSNRFRGIDPWQRELMDLTAYAGVRIEVIDTDPANAEHLLVPSRSVVVNGWAEPEAVDVWRSMAGAAGAVTGLDADGPRIFLTRTEFNAEQRRKDKYVRTSPERDLALDRAFADAGFEVVAPEGLSIHDQVRLAAGASVLAGSAGTALHLSAFAPEGVRVLELGDDRSPGVQVPQQLVLDSAREHPSAFVPYGVTPDELPEVFEALGL